MTLLVTPVTTPEEFQEAKNVRVQVFHIEQKFDQELEFDNHDDESTTIHFLGKDMEQDKVVAVARVLMDEPNRKAKIGRVAVLPECRGKGYGAALMDSVEGHIRHLTRVTTPNEMQQAMALRYRVFITEQGFNASVETDDPHDNKPSTLHFLGKDTETNEYVAVARCLLDEKNRKAKFGRVAVLSECRGKGFGVKLMDAIEDLIRDRVDMFILSAQYDKKVFYEKCGYQCTSDEVYLEEGAKHCWMSKSA
ncbi:hypothetical protein BBO99_00006976 [Phytophthora kernoviae]|uniref:N-acetyltransferase domain-containing protein n=1 Tax=Phytophthora kernoviae TaxID=325452 RepID=A0A3R7GW49_9STRA|nr:hypothetical protein JM16_006902 [Phytophthora kernoviae]KAG2521694.1 hypothetical protein JM18_006492 [Phytophthora kernoviae]RLN21577.1 hypothetical protein BBI17_006994 [Phytophthora kernoviae]RLN77155.1 hypothetical protein BBO99_00006976 [Phytophthora kernoviae]